MSDYFDRPSDTSTYLPEDVELPIKHDEEYFDRPHETASYNPYNEELPIPFDKDEYFDRPHETSTYTPADTPLPDEEAYTSAEDDMDNVTDEKDLSAVINLLEQAINKL